MGQLRIKDGVDFGPELAPSGVRILAVLKRIVTGYAFDLTITSARDGLHSGVNDPHHRGEAFDLRSHDLLPAQKAQVLRDLQSLLYLPPRRFYAFLEAAGLANEHFHIQVRQGITYTVSDLLTEL